MKLKFKTIITTIAVLLAVAFAGSDGIAQDVTKTTLKVQNLSCGSCLSKINAELQTLEGMVGMDADLWQGMVMVDHNSPLTSEKIAKVITELGYPATVLSQDAVTAENTDKNQPEAQKRNFARAGCGGCGSGGCGANASTWQKVYQRYLGKNNNPQVKQ